MDLSKLANPRIRIKRFEVVCGLQSKEVKNREKEKKGGD
jgi:hypothetical protein